ncbi:hypothetical protein [Dysgonomonas sp. ZJ709]|uniref:hypothetical protein n=1 Tax=Dysgonomonas sp. ZJ709 TaxID=2709797 RepID=UPI0013EC537C|nr:hypothetical protein [Dysgonomonas sp. ZJ709]
MNKEKILLTTALLNRIFHPISRFSVFMSQKSELLPHSFFFDCFRSKVIFRVTQNSPVGFFASPRKPCSARLSTTPLAPDGCSWRGLQQAFRSASDGRRSVGLSCTWRYRELFHNLKCICYGKR